jgi:hypothetical protein
MLPMTTMPIPGALRMRAMHPLIEGDGSCGLIYDLERAAVVEVPEELQFHVAPALETGDLDEDLLGWLVNEDLLTSEGGAGWSTPAEGNPGWRLGSIYRIDDELHVRIGQDQEDAALEMVGCVFKQSVGTGRVKLHLGWDGAFPGKRLLERIVVEATRLAGALHQDLSFDLTLKAGEVTPERAEFLAALPLQVRLLCGSYPAPASGFYADPRVREAWTAEPPVRLLLDLLGDRLTVHCRLDQGRLLDLWEWAKRTGVRRLDATILEDGPAAFRPGRPREVRNDLMAICEEIADELSARRLPIDFKPLTRVVDRLMRSEPLERSLGERGSLAGLMAMAGFFPRSVFDQGDVRITPDLWSEPDEEDEQSHVGAQAANLACRGCWARHVCGHSSYVASSQEDDPREPAEDRCSLWRMEVEAALRFYHRLAQMDPLQVRAFFEESSRETLPPVGHREDLGYLRMPF